MRTNFSPAVLIATFLLSPVLVAEELSESQRTAIDNLTGMVMEAGAYPSITVLIDRGGKTLYAKSTGTANLEQDRPAQADSAYAIGSITKSFTALATLQLAEAGKIDLDKPVRSYLPDYSGPGGDVVVRRLLDHTSGIPNYTGDIPGIQENLKRTAYSREQMVGFFAELPLQFEPGEKFNYTNSGYYLLGLIIEKVSGQDYYDYLQQNIFDPLDMTRSFSGDSAEIIPDRVSGYDQDQEGYINAPPWSYMVPFSAGSLVSTVGDLVKYRRGVFHSDSFSPQLREMLVQTNDLNDGTTNIYAQGGLIISNFEGHAKISHSGDIWGFAANHAYYPDDDLTIVILTNRQADAPSVVSLEQKISREVFGLDQPLVEDRVLAQAELDRIQGDYQLHPFIFGPATYGFIGQDGKLFIRFGGVEAEGPMLPLKAQGNGRFLFAFDDEWSFQFAVSPGQAASFESQTRDGTFQAVRAE